MERIFKNIIPTSLDKKTKDLIKQLYFDAIDDINSDEFDYINKKINVKIENTSSSSTTYVSELSKCYNILYIAYDKFFKNEIKLSREGLNLIAAALFYFINPFDIIPDYTPGIGYLDDYDVLLLCIKSLEK